MEVSLEKSGDVQIVVLRGRLDLTTAPDLERRLLGLLQWGGSKILIDAVGLTYISSSGLRVFLVAGKQLGPAGKLAFANLTPMVAQIFQTAGFRDLFPIFDSREAALQSLVRKLG